MISNAAFENSLDIGEESTVSKREVSGFEGFCCWLGGNMTTLFQGSWLEALSQLPVKWCYQYSCALPSHCFRYYFVWHAVKTKFSSSGSNLCTWHLSQSHFCLGMQKCEMWVKRASLLQWSSLFTSLQSSSLSYHYVSRVFFWTVCPLIHFGCSNFFAIIQSDHQKPWLIWWPG